MNDNDSNDFINNDLGITLVLHKNKLKHAIKKLSNNNNNNNNNVKYMSNDHQIKLKEINTLLHDVIKLNETIDKNKDKLNKAKLQVIKEINTSFDEVIRAANAERASLLDKINAKASSTEKFLNTNKVAVNDFKDIITKELNHINNEILFIKENDTRNELFKKYYDNIFNCSAHKLFEIIGEWNIKMRLEAKFTCDIAKNVSELNLWDLKFGSTLPCDKLYRVRKNSNKNQVQISQYFSQKYKHIIKLFKYNTSHNDMTLIKEYGQTSVSKSFRFESKWNNKDDYVVEHDAYFDDGRFVFKVYSHKFNILKSINIKNDLIVHENEIMVLKSDTLHEYNNVIIHKNGYLYTDPYKKNIKTGGKLFLKINDKFIVKRNAQINLNGDGYPGGSKRKNGCGPGKGIYYESMFGNITIGGGSYGTKCENGGEIYGNETIDTLYLGSGGAGGKASYGCQGGGAIKIICKSIHIGINAGIYCNGNGLNGEYCGGGSGGSIYIKSQNITNYGKILAKGGKTVNDTHGGYGRITINCKNINNYGCIEPSYTLIL